MTYRPKFQSQFGWGSRYDNQNCTMAAGAMLLDRQTLGRIVTNAPHLRELSGVGPTDDGTSNTDLARAIERGYGIKIQNPGPYEPFLQFEDKVRKGRGAVIAGDCESVRGKSRCPAGLARNHALYVNEVTDDGRFLVYDPADRMEAEGVQTLTRAQLRRYAENWTDVPGTCNAAYSRRTPETGDDGNNDSPLTDSVSPSTLIASAGVAGGIVLVAVVVIGAAFLFWQLGKGPSVMEDQT